MGGGPRPALRRRRWLSLATALVGSVMGLASEGCTSTTPMPQPTTVAAPASPTTDSAPSATKSLPTRLVLSPRTVVAGGTFTTGRLTFRFDRSWRLSTWDVVSTASTSIVYLTSQATHNPCVTRNLKHDITETECTAPVTSLVPGGVLINWYYFGLPGTELRYAPGQAVTIAGQPARLASGSADSRCTRFGGVRSIDATIEPKMTNGSPSLLHMDACLTRPAQTAPVLAMLRSLTFTAGAATTPPARFPPVADDDPCQPFRRGRYFRQPPGSGALPWSSTLTAARWCVAIPGPHGEQFTRFQSRGNVSGLTRALHVSLPVAGTTHVTCPVGPFSLPVAVEVLDQHGNLFRPSLPVDSCGAISATRNALEGITSTPLPGS